MSYNASRIDGTESKKKREREKEMVGEASFTIISDDPLTKMLTLSSTTMSSAGLEGMFPPETQKW